jgi:hypothetical protein
MEGVAIVHDRFQVLQTFFKRAWKVHDWEQCMSRLME